MSQKHTKKQTTPTDRIEAALSHAALGAMAVATVLSAVHLPERHEPKITPIMQPAFAVASIPGGEHTPENTSHQRLEEIRHPHASYGVTMRSHPTAGSI